MSFELVITGDTRPLDRAITRLDQFDETARKLVADIAHEAFDEIRAQMLDALRFYPPVPSGSRYKRTFRLRNNWSVNLEIGGGNGGLSVDLVVSNATPYTRWVVGTLSNIDTVARATQRAFHARNGWPIALDTTRFWFDAFKDLFIEAFTEAFIHTMTKEG